MEIRGGAPSATGRTVPASVAYLGACRHEGAEVREGLAGEEAAAVGHRGES